MPSARKSPGWHAEREQRSASLVTEGGRELFEKGAHPFGVVGISARLLLQIPLVAELILEIVILAFVERLLGQRQRDGRRRSETGGQRMRLGEQKVIVDRPP